MPIRPKYFFRLFSEKNLVTIQGGLKNFLMDMSSKDFVQIPGFVDAVPTPDEAFMLIPNSLPIVGGMRFFKIGNQKPLPVLAQLFKDSSLGGSYQSIGILNKDGVKTYRVVTQSLTNKKSGFFYKDYSISSKGELQNDETVAKKVCPNMNFVLPMISKSGKFLAGFDSNTRETIVMSLSEKGECEKLFSLGVPTGKVDFSFDDQWLAFHYATGIPELVTHVFGHPKKKFGKLVPMLFHIPTKKFYVIDTCTENQNCYYPSFKKDGSIGYFIENLKGEYDLVRVKLD